MTASQLTIDQLENRRVRFDIVSATACVIAIASSLGMGVLHEGAAFTTFTVTLILSSYLSAYMVDMGHVALVKLRSRLLTALNLLPSMAMSASENNPACWHSTTS